MKLREFKKSVRRYRGQRGPDLRPRKKHSQYRYTGDSAQSEAFKLQNFILPPCSVPRTKTTKRTYADATGQPIEYDATPSVVASHLQLTPKKIDRLYELTLQTHSLECAAWMICIPYFTVQQWLQEGKKYAEDVAASKVPYRKHALKYELYLRVMQARFLKLAEKRARILRNKGDSSAFRTLKVLEALDTGDFGFNRGKGIGAADALPLADEAYM